MHRRVPLSFRLPDTPVRPQLYGAKRRVRCPDRRAVLHVVAPLTHRTTSHERGERYGGHGQAVGNSWARPQPCRMPETPRNPVQKRSSLGADDGIRTRDPHLGNVNGIPHQPTKQGFRRGDSPSAPRIGACTPKSVGKCWQAKAGRGELALGCRVQTPSWSDHAMGLCAPARMRSTSALARRRRTSSSLVADGSRWRTFRRPRTRVIRLTRIRQSCDDREPAIGWTLRVRLPWVTGAERRYKPEE